MKLSPQFSIFPVKDKKPLVNWGEYATRLSTQEERTAWETQYPGCQYAIATGPISNLFVLDIDGEKGANSIKKYQLPRTPSVYTPHGVHYYFRWTKEMENKVTTKVAVLDGVDTRGSGGYVCFYRWQVSPMVAPFAAPPQWLIDLLPDKNGRSQITNNNSQIANTSKLQEILDAIHVGNRNDSFARAAGSFRSRGYTGNDIFTVLLPKAREVGFGERELRLICDSIGRYAPKVIPSGLESFGDFLTDIKKSEWLVPNMIAENSITFFAGLPKVAKTWVLMDLALEMAGGGGNWLGRFPVKSGKVLFIDQERPRHETQRRFAALVKNRGTNKLIYKDTLKIKCGSTIRLDLDNSYEAFRKDLLEYKPDLVIVDSFITFHTKDVKDQTSIQPVLERIKSLRTEIGCSFVFIYHDRKSTYHDGQDNKEPSFQDMVGSVFIPAAAEHCFSMRRHDLTSSFVYHTANNLGETIAPFLVKVVDEDETKSKISVVAF